MITTNNIINPAPWFSTWFDTPYYNSLYRHRNDKEAIGFIDTLLNELDPEPSSRILDLGCGSGRHSRYLASKGFDVTGIDLSSSSIRQAKKWENHKLHYFRHDMRIPYGRKRFDLVLNFFTSFGYFKTWEEHVQVVKNMSDALTDDGILLIDYLNITYTEKHLVPVDEKEIDGVIYHINRWSDQRFIYKRIALQDPTLPGQMEYVEQVARFGLEQFEELFRINGLRLMKIAGDYDLSTYDTATSKRLIIMARKNG